MAAFRYQSFDNTPYVQSASDLLQAGPRAQAQAALASGQAWAGAAQNIGQSIAAIPAQIQQQKDQALRGQLLQGQVADQQHARAGRDTLNTAIGASPLEPGQEGPQLPNFLKREGDVSVWDLDGVSKFMASRGFADQIPTVVKDLGGVNQAHREDMTAKNAALQSTQNVIAKQAGVSLSLMRDFGIPADQAIGLMAEQLRQNKTIPPDQLDATLQHLQQNPQAAIPLLQQLSRSGNQPGVKLGKDDVLLNPNDMSGPPMASNLVPEKPTTAGNEAAIRALYAKRASGAPMTPAEIASIKGYEDEKSSNDAPVTVKTMVNGRAVERVMTRAQALAAGEFPSQPAASVVIHNDQKNAPNLPAWALDDTRPTGPDANKLDPVVRMTPNGLYQAAQNYIATGQFPPTGRGSDPASVATRTAITSKVGAIAAAAGMDEPALRAFFKSNAASLSQQQKMQDSVQGFMATADKNAALLKESLSKIPDIGVPLFNQPIRAFEKNVAGDKNLSQFSTYLQSVQNEYARIISQPNLAGQLTDSARHEAEALLDPKATVPQIVASIDALQKEGNNRLVSVGETIQRIQQRMQVGQSGAAPAGAATAPVAPPGMMRVVGPNGQTGSMPVGNALPPGWKKQ